MQKEIKKLENSEVDVHVTLEKEEWQEAQEKALKEITKNMNFKGFRKGHVPEQLIKGRVSNQEIFSRAINDKVQEVFERVVDEEKFRLFARPSFDIAKVSEEEVEFVFHLTLVPDVTLGQYKDLGIARDKVEVNEEEINHEIAHLLENSATLRVKDDVAKNGDTVVIDFVGSIDGKEFEGGKAENYELELGSNTFIPGFEDQLIGHKNGDEVDVKVTFPENYGMKDLANKEALFKVKVHEVKEKIMPELNEETIKGLNIKDVANEEQLKAYQKAQILGRKNHDAEHKLYESIIDQIIAASEVEISPKSVASEVEGMKERLNQQLAQSGLKYEDYLKMVNRKEEDINQEFEENAKKNLKRVLVIEKIAELEKIKVEDDELEFEFAKIADQYHMPIEQVKSALGQDMDNFRAQVRSRRIQDFLISHNEAK